ncbi:sulfatase [uncultured Sunxiuqinia sp.]|uniref:sulfatase family protein n=1 Tax=uncultured Sunxiuqinia sp. TaxID=1573825 RepID=UPI002AA6EE53|nr:sulfatase [uncultured Sunxiuqinia sp.]
MKINVLILLFAIFISISACTVSEENKNTPPNYVVIFCDDMGYGDLGVYGHPTIRTPNLDKMADEGQKWTNFYVSSSVCTPSRAGIMTGRLPIRNGMCSDNHRVIFPESKGGLPESEITFAKILQQNGYATGIIGKWHLGHEPQFLPTSHGFDYFYGLKYSNDMDRDPNIDYWESCRYPEQEYFQISLYQNNEIIQEQAVQTELTKNYTREAVAYIEKNKEKPFALYLAHAMPHVPLFRSEEFEGASKRGRYGDVIEELDWSVGQVLKAIKDNGLADNTIVVFTSDNGPWLTFDTHGGTAGLLTGGKGSTYEGGMRVPAIFWGPGIVKPGVVMEMGSTLDLFPTFCAQSGIPLPQDRIYDGNDLTPLLRGGNEPVRNEIFYYRGTKIYAVRKGKYKAHFLTKSGYGGDPLVDHETPLLYDLEVDPSEKFNIADKYPEVIQEINALVEAHKKTLKPVTNQLDLY